MVQPVIPVRMKENKTKPLDSMIDEFLDAVEPERKRSDARVLCDLFSRLSGEPPVMWGPSIIGFGHYCYRYDSGREGEMCRIGFSPRKANLVIYMLDGYAEHAADLEQLGKHKTGKSCLYITRLADIDLAVLERMILRSLAWMNTKYPQ